MKPDSGQCYRSNCLFDGPTFGKGQYFDKPESFPPVEQPVPDYFDWICGWVLQHIGHTMGFMPQKHGVAGSISEMVNWRLVLPHP
jgi:hypothetical protein